jgi:hypothetical protein
VTQSHNWDGGVVQEDDSTLFKNIINFDMNKYLDIFQQSGCVQP